MRDYSKQKDRDLLRQYRQLERAMQTCTDGDEYVRCMSVLNDMADEIQARGLDVPELQTEYERRCSYLERGDHA